MEKEPAQLTDKVYSSVDDLVEETSNPETRAGYYKLIFENENMDIIFPDDWSLDQCIDWTFERFPNTFFWRFKNDSGNGYMLVSISNMLNL